MACTARIRPFPNDTEVACIEVAHHGGSHVGELRDYAYPGSLTRLGWLDHDRRCFHGDWPGYCRVTIACVLPVGHHGRCAP